MKYIKQQTDKCYKGSKYVLLMTIVTIVTFGWTGCATTQSTTSKQYIARKVKFSLSRKDVMELVVDMVREEGWKVVDIDKKNGIIEALTSIDKHGEMLERYRWFFTVNDNYLSIVMKNEMKFEPHSDAWLHNDRVCPGYGYAKETLQVSKLEQRIWKKDEVITLAKK